MSVTPALAFDEFGRPFIILKDQSSKTRLRGIEAHKVRRNIDIDMLVMTRVYIYLFRCTRVFLSWMVFAHNLILRCLYKKDHTRTFFL